jgi:hypothetical protein
VPAQVIPEAPGITVPRYSVVGKYTSESGSRFVEHVALIRDEGPASHGTELAVWQMGPPLVAGTISSGRNQQDARCPAHVVGWLSFTSDERDGITDWLAEIDKQLRPNTDRGLTEQYTVSLQPEDQWHCDEKEVPLYRRFSCVSFVLAAYLEGAAVNLIDTSSPEILPEVGLETVARAYGENLRRRDHVRTQVGVPGAGPWRILLAGYVCHAMNRPDALIRSTPYRVPCAAASDFPTSS